MDLLAYLLALDCSAALSDSSHPFLHGRQGFSAENKKREDI